MHIKHITVKNFRCFEHLEFDLNPDINIFVGNNGSGKSAVLDAIAAAMFPYLFAIRTRIANKTESVPLYNRDFSVMTKNTEQRTQIEFEVSVNSFNDWMMMYQKTSTSDDNERADYNYSSLLKSHEKYVQLYSEILANIDPLAGNKTSQLSLISYYRSDRNLTNTNNHLKVISNQSFDRLDSLAGAFDATANFTDLLNWFFVREFQELREGKNQGNINYELPDLKQVRNAIKTIIHPEARVYCTQTNSIQLMVEWTMETGEKQELTLNQLSAGYRNMLALVMDFARRLAQANPHLENPLEAEAILMIDELDLHLHPTWQQKIIPDLRKVFPNTQIIATT